MNKLQFKFRKANLSCVYVKKKKVFQLLAIAVVVSVVVASAVVVTAVVAGSKNQQEFKASKSQERGIARLKMMAIFSYLIFIY